MSSICAIHGIGDPCYKCAEEAKKRKVKKKKKRIKSPFQKLCEELYGYED